jgi:pimeloyl-ACP methyl ester carboxylesterase
MRYKSIHKSNIHISLIFIALILLTVCDKSGRDAEPKAPPVDVETLKSRLVLETDEDPETKAKISRGTFAVFEDRDTQTGSMIHLDVVILHATGPDPKPDPIVPLAGGPGQNAVSYRTGTWAPWIRRERDIVLVSQRGTGGDNNLFCKLGAGDDNLQVYLDPTFVAENFRPCLEELKDKFDLTKYSTCHAADDLNELRLALGYEKINLTGVSYGTRAALVYMRRHPETVRTAILNGVAPTTWENPLHHAPSAQEAIELLFAECAEDPDCNAALPNLEEEFWTVIERLEHEPADVTVTHPATEERVTVKLHREAFSESVRMMMYSWDISRMLPSLIHQAFKGDYEKFAQYGMEVNRGVLKTLSLGMLLSVTCAEDLERITEEEIVEFTSGTYMGDGRVRRQKAVCDFWPKSKLPANYGGPVRSKVPVLLLSGTLDPVTRPKFAEHAALHLPNSLHVVAPGAHGVGGKCIESIKKQFLQSGSIEGLDVSCVDSIKLTPFRILEK